MSALPLSPRQWPQALRRQWQQSRLKDERFRFLFDAPPADEWVSLDCETTGLDVNRDEIVSIGAVRIAGRRVLTSQRLELLVRPTRPVAPEAVRVHRLLERDVAHGLAPGQAVQRLLHFVGSRPLVGYYLEFDVAMIERVMRPLLGIGLPQPKIEISGLYYDHKYRHLRPEERGRPIDLRFATLMDDLQLPRREAHDAVNDAVMAALAFVKLRALESSGRG